MTEQAKSKLETAYLGIVGANVLHQDCVGMIWSNFIGSSQTTLHLSSDSNSL